MINIYKDNEPISFYNSGDRVGTNIKSEEVKLCKKLGIKYIEFPLPKLYSLIELIE